MRNHLLAMPPDVCKTKSQKACTQLVALEEFQRAQAVMMFLTIPGEVDTTDAILAAWQQDKTVLVPRVSYEHKRMEAVEIASLESGLTEDNYGIRTPTGGEPWPMECIDLIAVPALAYDRSGGRLGKGGGFYDRYLAHPQVRALTCGLGFDEQIVAELPLHSHDFPIRMLVTDRGVLRFNR